MFKTNVDRLTDRQTDRRTDICISRAAFAAENEDFIKDSVNFLLEFSGINPSSAILMAKTC